MLGSIPDERCANARTEQFSTPITPNPVAADVGLGMRNSTLGSLDCRSSNECPRSDALRHFPLRRWADLAQRGLIRSGVQHRLQAAMSDDHAFDALTLVIGEQAPSIAVDASTTQRLDAALAPAAWVGGACKPRDAERLLDAAFLQKPEVSDRHGHGASYGFAASNKRKPSLRTVR